MNDDNLPLADLAAYLRAYSIMISAGVSLMRCMDILTGQIVHDGLREAHLDCMRQIEEGTTLSGSMSTHPDVFNHFLIGLVRAGEVGGVLDETLARAADFYEKQLTLRRDRLVQYATARILGRDNEDRYNAALREVEQLTVLQYFCYMFGTMLASGVPLVQALQTAAEILPDNLAEAVRATAQAARTAEISTLAPSFHAAGFPGEVTNMMAIGEECGSLERMMLQAGDVVGARVDGMLLRALWA